MSAQIVLIAPENPDPALLAEVLDSVAVSALIVPRRGLAENAYKDSVKALVQVTQSRDCAILIEGEPGLVRLLGADGVHVDGDAALVAEAVARLKPQMIVGASATSRDDAMAKGELDVDYVRFADPLLAGWWADTMEIPAVLDLTGELAESIDAEGCEFVALSDNVWNAKQGPVEALKGIAGRLEQA